MKIQTVLAILLVGFCFSNSGFAWQDPPPVKEVAEMSAEELTAEMELPPQDVDEKNGDAQIENQDAEVQDDEMIEEAPMLLGGTMEEQFIQTQTQAAASELKQLQDQLNLDDEWIEKLKSSLEEDIEAVGKEMAAEANTSVGFGFDSAVNSKLRSAMWKKIEEALPEGKEAEFEEFKKMISKMQELSDETAVKGLLVFLDNQLCLSQQQVDRLQTIYSENWDSGFNEQVGAMVINGMIFGRAAIDLVSEEEFEKTLTEKQLEVFKSLNQSSNFMMALQMGAMGGDDDGVNLEAVRTQCDDALDLKIAEYEALVGLTEKQKKMLGVARKGAASRVVDRLGEMFKKANENLNMIGMDLEVMDALMEPVVSQCTRESAWQKTLQKVFDEDQLEKVNARENARREMAIDQVVNYMIFSMIQTTNELGLNYEQHVKLVELVKSKLGDKHHSYFGVAIGIFKASDEEFQEILTDEQWSTFEPMIESQRASFEEMMGDDEDSDDESDEDSDE